MTPSVSTEFVVTDPKGGILHVSLSVSAPRQTDDGQWEVEVVCPAVPYATGTCVRNDPVTCLCFALSHAHSFMLDEFSKGYSVEGWGNIGDFVDELFCVQSSIARKSTDSRSRTIDYDALLKAIEDLMGRLPGIDNVHAGHTEGKNHVQFRCRSMEALSSVEDIATAANLVVRVWSSCNSSHDQDNAQSRDGMEFGIAIHDDPTDETTDTEAFGFFLISHLAKQGSLPPEARTEFARLFGGDVT